MKLLVTIILCLFIINSFSQEVTKSDTVLSLQPEIKNKILSESKDVGIYDFWTLIKGHEYDGALVQSGANTEDNIYASNREIAVIKWACSLSKTGIKRGDIILLYGKLKGRKIREDEMYF